ncbi:TPA: polymannosyl GlcNAc-diphospho-ditrans,octacis-undecaprenol 2,3-alpha-mannosylpolymerase WbdA [Klebsiella quasipneumoniae subsp. quasipneumoniae]|nr:polymannosyl GlcNAc-diphospho-ditrans,octacis-undecaprenol 2,3-alpha-mannosylpolymerase WbdA [Klebsiella quasipneumoniae subsp. quasipneumoniae]
MHILIDVQGYQSESKFRGIGRSTLAMSRAIIENAGEHRVSILINGMYPIDNINDVKMAYRDLLADEDMFIFSAVAPTAYCNIDNHGRSKAAQAARDIAIANIAPDIVYVISFFEGHGDSYTVSIPADNVPWRTVCVCHDLIPLLNKERYLGDPNFREFYMNKLAEFERADAIFAISQSAAQEVIEYTDIASDRVLNISSAVGEEFAVIDYSAERIQSLKDKYSLPDEFILTLAMIEPRKNIEALIHAYSMLPAELQQRYPMVLAYKVHPEDLERILRLAESYGLSRSQLIFTGFLTDDDLIALYNLCKLFVFPSLHEGFGLPPLEAMRCGAATLGSNITSLPEVIGWEDAMFNPHDVQDIRRVMEKALTDEAFYRELKAHALTQSAKFSWANTAHLAIDGFTRLLQSSKEAHAGQVEGVTASRIQTMQKIDALSEVDRLGLAWAVARNGFKRHTRKLLVDISVLAKHDAKTGIQRVSRSILSELLKSGVPGYEVSAVYYTPGECYRYANQYLSSNFPGEYGADEPVLFSKDDILIATDLTAHLFPEVVTQIDSMRAAGAFACFVVHDILPLRRPEWSIEGIQREFPIWLSCLAEHADRLICVSASVAEDVKAWIAENSHWVKPNPLLTVSNFHLGADLDASVPSTGMPDNAQALLATMAAAPSFIMVGTMEPRKGHAQTLAAFEELWREGKEYNLFIVGKQGWNVDSLCEKLRHHPQLNKKLFWLQNISDEFLAELYARSRALIFASQGEGFGLPLIEAAQKKLPVIIRDIPVFKEIAQEHAWYFSGEAPADIAKAVEDWLALYEQNAHPRSENINWLTWKQSAEFLLKNLPIIAPAAKQ